MSQKGHEFKGFFAGKWYDRLTSMLGMGKVFYKRALGPLTVPERARVLDLGCGTGALLFCLAKRSPESAEFYGIDFSEEQVDYACKQAKLYPQRISIEQKSMDEAEFPDEYFDLIMSSMALHEVSPRIRSAALANAARMLKPGGHFLLVDLAKPKRSLLGTLAYLMLRSSPWNQDNLNNVYPALCDSYGLARAEDGYINFFVRRQLFVKQ